MRDKKVKDNKKVKDVKRHNSEMDSFMSTERIEKMKNILKKIQNYTNVQLKDILRRNGQSMSGSKIDLLGKVSDGIMFGKIPKCSNCNGGRPKMDMSTGEYHCEGYYEDETYNKCDTTFQFDSVQRDEWIE